MVADNPNIRIPPPKEEYDQWWNKIVTGDFQNLPSNCRIGRGKAHLMITSPPYGVGLEYEEGMDPFKHRGLLRAAWKFARYALAPGGRVCINVAATGRKPYTPLHAHVIDDMLNLGFALRGEIVWNKGASRGNSTGWGSWRSASDPSLRDEHEYILVFTKGAWKREPVYESTISKEEFIEYTRSVWTFQTESAKRLGHPAPFPVELPKRCIKLFSYKGDLVIDPFMGSGTTAVAAVETGRGYWGCEIDKGYAEAARKRVAAVVEQGELL